MARHSWRVMSALTLFLAAVLANNAARSAEDPKEQLARRFAAALQARDSAMVTNLLHPQVRACMNASNYEYFDDLINNFSNTPPRAYRISVTTLADPATLPSLPPEMFRYPIRPTYQFEIEWQTKPSTFISLIRPIAAAGGAWYVVYQCPSPAGLKFMHSSSDSSRE